MKELISLSIVPPRANAPVGQLAKLNLAEWLVTVRDCMKDTGTIKWAVVCTDISANDYVKRRKGVEWQFQAYAIVLTTNRRKLREVLSAQFPATSTVPRPIRTHVFDNSPKGISYAYKYQFVRRASFQKVTKTRTYWSTRKVSLKAYEHIELMLALDKLGLTNRIRLIGLVPHLRGGSTVLKRS